MSAASQFHSVPTNEYLPTTGTVGDVWWVQQTGQLWFVVGDGSLHELLTSTPIPVQGATGATGPQGPAGQDFIGTVGFFGSWQSSPVEYQAGSIVSFNGFLYMSKSYLNISDNTQAPEGNPFWQVLGAVNTTRSSEIVFAIDGASATPPLGFKGYVTVPYNGTLTGWVLLADQSGSASLDVRYSTYSGLPNTSSIINGAGPTLSSAQKAEGSVSSWTVTSVNAGDVIEVDLTSVSGSITFLTLTLQIQAEN